MSKKYHEVIIKKDFLLRNSGPLFEDPTEVDVRVLKWDPKDPTEEYLFDMVGVDASIANSFRRIIIDETPGVAFEYVFINPDHDNELPDDMLSHRVGLVPLNIDPRIVEFAPKPVQLDNDQQEQFDFDEYPDFSHIDHFVFDLQVENPSSAKEAITVHSGDFVWRPNPGQKEKFGNTPPAPLFPKIALTKALPGQKVSLRAVAIKGLGKDHSKFSPTATTFYRILPVITFKEDIVGKEAKELVKTCPVQVFDIEDTGKAFVKNPRSCTMCRECVRSYSFSDKIELKRNPRHFLFSIESCSPLSPSEIFIESTKVLIQKCDTLSDSLREQVEKLSFNSSSSSSF